MKSCHLQEHGYTERGLSEISEISQREKNKYCIYIYDFTYMWYLNKQKK